VKEKFDVEVLDLRTISPLDDKAILASVAKTGRAIVVHEAVKICGIGAEIAARITEGMFDQLKAPVRRLGGKFSAVPFSKPLESAFVPTAPEIQAAIHQLLVRRVR
jgi:acetoin:2,6-dichlorophenolindophenol oxidoreductase subunit beta